MFRLDFCVDGKPKGKARPRFNTLTGRAYTPKATGQYEAKIARIARQEMRLQKLAPATGAVEIFVEAFFEPATTTKEGKRIRADLADGFDVRCPKKPDFDNILKAVCDALNGIVYKDDSQIVGGKCVKKYSLSAPYIHVLVKEFAQ